MKIRLVFSGKVNLAKLPLVTALIPKLRYWVDNFYSEPRFTLLKSKIRISRS